MKSDYNRSEGAQETFKAKRKLKNPIKFNIQLNDEQKLAKEVVINGVITALRGRAGSGKSLLETSQTVW
jgi:predicted ribonuclease YlaK